MTMTTAGTHKASKQQHHLQHLVTMAVSLSKVAPLLFPAFLITGFLSFYHVSLLTNQNCLIENERAGFAVPSGADKNNTSSRRSPANAGRTTTDSPYAGPYKIFPKWTEPFPCVPVEKQWKSVKVQRSPSREGLLYVREMKTGSSTLAGVILSIAHRKAQGKYPCKMRVDHSPARKMDYRFRDKKKSFLISLLRDPTRRAISQFFHFRVSEDGVQPTDERFLRFLYNNSQALSNYYVRDLAMHSIKNLDEMENDDELVQEIINEYDFIGITERMDESLVVLKMLLDLDFGDILYMSAKTQGSFTAGGGGPKQPVRCIYIVPSFTTPGMNEFFASDYWKRYIAADVALYNAVNASLDKTIESLGRQQFEEELAVFQKIKEQAQKQCMSRTIYRCDATGRYVGAKNSTCLLWDVGCGHDCLGEFANEMKI